ncbi:MAG TPA: hypothetical protein VNH44_03765 [Micropepsaceae bacterium]|nr:hypothetical protein [Micropepsaceae bacterium]
MRGIGWGVAALLAMASSAHAAGWQTYTYRDQGFSVESTVPLTQGKGLYKGAIAGAIPTITYSGEAENIRYKVSIVDISKRPADAVNLYLEMEFLTSLSGKVLANESVGIEPGKDRHYGRQLVIQAKDGSLVRTVLVYNKGKIYITEATILPNGDKDSFSPERFVESILFDLDGAARERDNDPANFKTPDGK